MSGQIPKKSADCRHCHQYQDGQFVGYVRCDDHPEGRDYEGPDLYEPSEWVTSVVGSRYCGGFGEGQYECTGYDIRLRFLDAERQRSARPA